MHKKADFDQVYKFSLLSRAPATMSRNHHATHSKTGKKTVMICDDERDLLQLFGQAIRSKYNVILVSSGEECIEIH
jgi:hypothetical protein